MTDEPFLMMGWSPADVAAMRPEMAARVRASYRATIDPRNAMLVINARRYAAQAMAIPVPESQLKQDAFLLIFACTNNDERLIKDRVAAQRARAACEQLAAQGWDPSVRNRVNNWFPQDSSAA
jgi:hypothetical protein